MSRDERFGAWVGGRQMWRIVGFCSIALIGVAFYDLATAYLAPSDSQELKVYGSDAATPGVPSTWRLQVVDGREGEALEGVLVKARLVGPEGEAVWSGEVRTDADGTATVAPDLAPTLPVGRYALELEARSAAGESQLSRSLELRRDHKVLITTDKPLYQPGQLIHLRTLTLSTLDLKPAAGSEVLLEILDPKGNKVFKKRLEASAHGIASADFQLADQVNTGDYTISATVGETVSERGVTVERYVLPKYKVSLSTDRPYYQPGERVRLELSAQYTFGKPVTGARVEVVARAMLDRLQPFATLQGITDKEGHLSLEVPLTAWLAGQPVKGGDAFVTLEATVVDSAEHQRTVTHELTVTDQPLKVDLLPESGGLVPGVPNTLYVLTSLPDGRPIAARVEFVESGESLETGEDGVATLVVTPGSDRLALAYRAETSAGLQAEGTATLEIDDQRLLLRTDQASYAAGEALTITVLSADDGRVFLDLVKDRRTLLMKALDVKEGRGELTFDLPLELPGTLMVHAYRIGAEGETLGDSHLVQVRPARDLLIHATLDAPSYRPGETARLELSVENAEGEGVPSALGIAGVDEAVFALHEMRPGLERIYFLLQEELLTPRYQIHRTSSPRASLEGEDTGHQARLGSAASGHRPELLCGQSVGWEEKSRVYLEGRRSAVRHLLGALAILPFLFFLGFLLPTPIFSLRRLISRTPISGEEVDPEALPEFHRGVLWVVWLGPLTLLLPFFGMWAGVEISRDLWGWGARDTGTLVGGGLAVALCLYLLYLPGKSARRKEVGALLPDLRRALGFLPLAYGSGILALVAVAWAAHERAISETLVVVVGLVVPLAFLFSFGLLGAGSAAATKKTGVLGWFVRSLSSVGGLAVVLVLLGALVFGDNVRALFGASADALAGSEGRVFKSLLPFSAESAPGLAEGPAGGEASPRIRRHFPETLLWAPEVITDADGKATLEIPLADSITTWRLSMSAVSARGELGSGEAPLRVFQPFFVDVDFPVSLTQHDRLEVPVVVYNYLETTQAVRLEAKPGEWFDLEGPSKRTLTLGPREVKKVGFPVRVLKPGDHAFTVLAFGQELSDAVERRVRVLPDGREVVQTINGRLDENQSVALGIPAAAIDGASDLFVKVYPGAFSQVVEGLDGILRMPSGCFEQTSSSTYPNILVLDYLRRNKMAKPDLEMKALGFINTGYQRLLSFEVDGGGFEWYGRAPAHLVLTAYGLMEFSDMAKVHEVDPAVIQRTRDWLFAEQAGDGTWDSKERGHGAAISQFQGDVFRTTAYVAWALAESGGSDRRLERALDGLEQEAGQVEDAYSLAVAANALIAGGRKPAELLKRLEAMKVQEDKLVHWSSGGESLTHGRGDTLNIETTALIAYAFLKVGHHTATAHAALAWLVEKKDSFGTWHSTQATVHGMRALLAGTSPGGAVEEEARITLIANGQPLGELTVNEDNADVFHLFSAREHLREGKNQIRVESTGGANLAFQVVSKHYLPWPRSRPAKSEAAPPLSIDVSYDSRKVAVDDTLLVRVEVEWHGSGIAMMTLIDLGLPPGFDLIPDGLASAKADGRIQRWDPAGRQLIVYLDELRPGEPLILEYELRARFPLVAKTPVSTVYQYYEPELRSESPPVEIVVR